MQNIPRKTYWPYDEVTVQQLASGDAHSDSKFVFSAPWLTIQLNLRTSALDKAKLVAEKLSKGECTADDLNDVSWLFSAVAKYPFAYILPRADMFGEDQHAVLTPALGLATPAEALREILNPLLNDVGSASTSLLKSVPMNEFVRNSLAPAWSWDFEAALEFSKTPNGYDPEALFSISRRFHLLNDLENNKTAELVEFMSSLQKGSEEFLKNSALMLRQNHYITKECDRVLRSSLPLSQHAEAEVLEFMQAEKGHDKFLERGLKSLGFDVANVPVLESVIVFMEIFHQAGARNLLAFSMIVDIFERTSYREQDPFAKVLKDGGAEEAADHIDVHREINDSGGHENVAIGFLKHMKPVSAEYAIEALKFCELLTQVIHCLSRDTLTKIRPHG